MPMNSQFRAVFEKSIREQMVQNERARKELEGFLESLRARTEQRQTGNAPPLAPLTAVPPAVSEASLVLAPPNAPAAILENLNPVSQDWIKTVIQAANLDSGFLQETGLRATQIVTAAIQQPLSPVEDPVAVSTPPDSG